MNKLVLANIDYRTHMTDEGDQLQEGLRAAGWHLAGAGYDDGCKDVPTLLDRHRPDIVFIQDKRDWDPDNSRPGSGCFNPNVGFDRLEALAEYGATTVTPLKDFWFNKDYWLKLDQQARISAWMLYYSPISLKEFGPAFVGDNYIRTYHSVDADYLNRTPFRRHRRRAVLTGAISFFYPLRKLIAAGSALIRCDVRGHPGYHNKGSDTRRYLSHLGGYRVSIATCSGFNLALRKIFESVACGCTVVTNLPESDPLPEIDGALLRLPPGLEKMGPKAIQVIADIVAQADREWRYDERLHWALKARAYYDYRAVGHRLSEEICKLDRRLKSKSGLSSETCSPGEASSMGPRSEPIGEASPSTY